MKTAKVALLFSLAITFTLAAAAQGLRLKPHTTFGGWGDGSVRPGDYYWLTATSGTGIADNLNRGMAYNPFNNHLYIPYRTNSTSPPEGIHILDADSGAEVGLLDISGITNRGTITMVKIAVAEDGAIYAMNFGTFNWSSLTNATVNTLTTIYRWANESSVATIAFATNPAPTTASQWGYTFDIRGGGTNTQILLTTSTQTGAGGTVASFLTTTNGTQFTPAQLNTDAAPGAIGYFGAAGFGPGNSFWAKSLNGPLQYFSFDPVAGTATTLRSYDFTEFPPTIGLFGVNLQSNWVAGVDLNSPFNAMLFSFTNTTGEMTFLSKIQMPSSTLNRYAMGSVCYRKAGTTNMVYILNCNNGVWALDIAPEAAPSEAPYVSGPVVTYGPAGSDITMSAFVQGNPAPSIQWQVSYAITNGPYMDLPGQTSSRCTIAKAQPENEGLYRIVASNEFGVTIGSEASLLVVPDSTGILNPLWSINAGGRPYVTAGSSGTPVQRSIAYNTLSNHVIIVSRTNNANVGGLTNAVLDGSTGAYLYNLDKTGISGGTLILNSVAASEDGSIYACNEVDNASTSAILRVYRWANSGAATVPKLIFTNSVDNGMNGVRWGDTLDVRGSGTNTQIFLDSNDGARTALLFPTDSTLDTWTNIILGNLYGTGTLGRSLQFGPTNTFVQKRKGDRLLLSSYDTGTLSTAELANYVYSTNFGPVAVDWSRKLLATIEFALPQQPNANTLLPDMLLVYNVADFSKPQLIGRFPTPAGQFNARGNSSYIGEMAFGGDRLYMLEGNNGVLAFQIPDPTLTLRRSGSQSALNWVNADRGFKPQYNSTVTGGWTDVPETTVNVRGHFSVTNTTTDPARFYRLKK